MTNIYVKSQNKMERRESERERDAEKTAAFSIFAQVNEEQKVNEINTHTNTKNHIFEMYEAAR